MNSPSPPKALAERDAVNTNAPPDPGGNKNGAPGPSGNQKGPPTPTPTTGVLASPTLTNQTLTTGVSSSDNPPSLTDSSALTSFSTIVTSVLTPSTTESRTSVSATPSLGSSSLAVITSSDGVYTTLFPVETTLRRTAFTSTSSMTSIQTGVVLTSQSEHNAASPGLKAGIAIGTIVGFAFVLAVILLLFKYCKAKAPEALPSRGSSRWLPRSQTPDAISDSLLTRDLGSSDNPTWDYRATFARPTMAFKSNPNPLGLNPVMGARPPSLKSFTSFFHQLSGASSHHSSGQSENLINPEAPPLPPPYMGFLPTTLSALPGRLARPIDDTGFSPSSTIEVLQVPPQAFHARAAK